MSESVYARPVAPRIMFLPTVATVVMHGLMILAVTANWQSSEDNIITPTVIPPEIVNATLVDIDEFRPKPKPKPKPPPPKDTRAEERRQAEIKRQQEAKRQAEVKKQAEQKRQAEAKRQAEVKRQEEARRRAEEEAAQRAEQERRAREAAERQRAEEARRRAQAEQDRAMAASYAEMSASYAGLIQRTVINYWSRPPSARNGMEVLLSIQLIPTGDIVSVTVLKSSGNSAFDRSAINAVEKAGSFPELKNLPIREFERTFRRFRLLFRPEDLRY